MNKEAQRIAIAKACGHKALSWYGHVFIDGINKGRAIDNIPDYLNDLNAMHEAEKFLNQEQCYIYNNFLGDILGDWKPENKAKTWPFHATAEQKAEAFLRTIGEWK